MNSYITIKGLEIFAYHGVFESEKEKGQKFYIDLELYGDFSAAAKSDKLIDTEDYGKITETVKAVALSKSCDLIEHLAYIISDEIIKEFTIIDQVKVSIHKPSAPVNSKVEDIIFTLSMDR